MEFLKFLKETVTDADGNIYYTVNIGDQMWTKENLRTTKYNDGTAIPLVTDKNAWGSLITPGYCWYDNVKNNMKKYGALYNWYAVNTGKLAPKGWHVPSDREWNILEEYLAANGYRWRYNWERTTVGYGGIAKSLAAKIDWKTSTTPTSGGTIGTIGNNLTENNRSGFSSLPGGYLYKGNAIFFSSIGQEGYWWSATECDASSAWSRCLSYRSDRLDRDIEFGGKSCGLSIRLLRD